MPKFKDTRGKGLKIFKGKAGKGMPEEIHTALVAFLPRLPNHGRYVPPVPYAPPATVLMRSMRDLRLSHRNWLAPNALGYAKEVRIIPATFAPGANGEALVPPRDRVPLLISASLTHDGGHFFA
jgi:hypothetical protein